MLTVVAQINDSANKNHVRCVRVRCFISISPMHVALAYMNVRKYFKKRSKGKTINMSLKNMICILLVMSMSGNIDPVSVNPRSKAWWYGCRWVVKSMGMARASRPYVAAPPIR